MTHAFRITTLLLLISFQSFAKGGKDSAQIEAEREIFLIDSITNAMQYQTGKITLPNGTIQLNLPAGFKFLNAAQSDYVIEKVWGNPPGMKTLGLIFRAQDNPFSDSNFVFVITYEEDGYVKDEEANKIDYTDLMKSIQAAEKEENKKRMAQGYASLTTFGWAQTPYYDANNKVLHWAKELVSGDSDEHTLNYDVRVLGRKGVLSLNAVARMNQLPLVKANIGEILKMATFTEGNKYSDFNSSTDKVAEYGIGALVAGGILAKTGLLAGIGKFFIAAWKFIALGAVALWGGIKKLMGRKKQDDVA